MKTHITRHAKTTKEIFRNLTESLLFESVPEEEIISVDAALDNYFFTQKKHSRDYVGTLSNKNQLTKLIEDMIDREYFKEIDGGLLFKFVNNLK